MKTIYWIKTNLENRLAIVARPRGLDWLGQDLDQMHEAGIDTLVSMLERDEEEGVGLADEERLAQLAGMTFLHYPIRDRSLPREVPSFQKFVSGLARRVESGEGVGVHCWASIGRSTVVAACVLIHLGVTASEALDAITVARGYVVPDTDEQRDWILDYQTTGPRSLL